MNKIDFYQRRTNINLMKSNRELAAFFCESIDTCTISMTVLVSI